MTETGQSAKHAEQIVESARLNLEEYWKAPLSGEAWATAKWIIENAKIGLATLCVEEGGALEELAFIERQFSMIAPIYQVRLSRGTRWLRLPSFPRMLVPVDEKSLRQILREKRLGRIVK